MADEHSIEKVPRFQGGEARAISLSTERKKAISKLAAEARWGADLPRATHDGPLQIGDATLVAAVFTEWQAPDCSRHHAHGHWEIAHAQGWNRRHC